MSEAITTSELRKLFKEKKDLTILDVRRKSDYEADKVIIPGAVWRDPEQVEQWSQALPRERKVIVYCARGGSVSQSVSNRLQEEGVRVSYIEGGIATWKESGGEVESK
jgi:rhodanese-related sulfurtransferase